MATDNEALSSSSSSGATGENEPRLSPSEPAPKVSDAISPRKPKKRLAGYPTRDDEGDLKIIHDANYIVFSDELKEELVVWAKRRLWIVAIVGTIGGGLGGYHVFQEALRALVEDKVNAQITRLQQSSDRIADKFDANYQKYFEQLTLLKSTNDTLIKTSKDAQAKLKFSSDQLETLSEKAKEIESKLVSSKSQIQQMITDDANVAHDGTFEVASQNDVIRGLQAIQFNYIEDRLSAIEGAVKDANSNTSNPDRIKNIISSLVDKVGALRSDFLLKKGHILDNSKVKIILYVRDIPWLNEQAVIASERLRQLGYKVDFWKTHSSSASDARAEIAKDFKGAESAIQTLGSAILISDKQNYHSTEIKETLSALSPFSKIQTKLVGMTPDDVFRQRRPEDPYDSSDVILAFLISSD